MKRGAGSGRDEKLRLGTARIAEWRRTRQPGMRIPVELWELAVELAQCHGVSRTSQALPVAYYALQERVAAAGETTDETVGVSPAAKVVSPATTPSGKRLMFVELPAARGTVFVFRNRRSTAVKVLAYDGQGVWLCQKRLSTGRFNWWPEGVAGQSLAAHEFHVLLSSRQACNSLESRRDLAPEEEWEMGGAWRA